MHNIQIYIHLYVYKHIYKYLHIFRCLQEILYTNKYLSIHVRLLNFGRCKNFVNCHNVTLQVLTHHVRYPIIPKRVTIGKRLAQCLHPVLPSGVHLKVLETYDIIFKCIGTQRLAADLFTYSAGLFPLLAYSAMNVKPSLLSLFENHFVPLGRHIRPAMTGILQGLLPGLEDASEHHDRWVGHLGGVHDPCQT